MDFQEFKFHKTIGIRFHSRLRGLIAQRSGFGKTQRGTTQLLLGVCHAAPSRHGQLGAQELAAAHSCGSARHAHEGEGCRGVRVACTRRSAPLRAVV